MHEEEEEDYIHDIISWDYVHIKTEEPIIDLATSSDDEPEDDKSQIGMSWYGNRSFVLPITFFDVSSNVEFLKKCRPLSVKVVDCDKHPSYYEKLLRPKKTITPANGPILTQTAERENGETDEATAKKSSAIIHPSCHEKLLRLKSTISAANCPILPQTTQRENGETGEATAKKSSAIIHPSCHEKLLRLKGPISAANCPILPQTTRRENGETDEATAKKSSAIIHPSCHEKLLPPKRPISAANCPILPQTAERENGETDEVTAKKLSKIIHPSYYESLLQPKRTISAANCPILPQTTERENDETDEATAKKSTVIRHTEMHKAAMTPVPKYSQTKNEIDKRKAQVSLKSNMIISNYEREKQKVFKSQHLTQFDLKCNQGLLGLVVGKNNQENAAHGHKHPSADKKLSNEIAKKDLIEDISKGLRNKFEAMITGLTHNKIKDFSEKRSNNGFTQEEKERSKKTDVHNRNEQNSESSPTRCSIKMTSSKVFEKAIKLKKTHGKKVKDKANSELSTTLVSETATAQDKTVPKLSLKRKMSEHKEFYVINPTKPKSKSQCPNKKIKLSEETRGRLPNKSKHLKATNESQCNPTQPDLKIASYVKDSPNQSTLPGSPSLQRSEKHQKSVIVTPSNDTASNIKSYQNYRDLGKCTSSTQIENKVVSSVCLQRLIKNQINAVQKSNEKLAKSKNHINCLNPTSSDAKFSENNSMEKNSASSGHISHYSVVAKNIRYENIRPNQYVILQKTPPAGFKGTIKTIKNKTLETPMNCQVQSNICVQNPIDPVVSVANSNIPNISPTGKTPSLNKDLQFPLMKQSRVKADTINRTEPYMSHPESQLKPQNVYSIYNNVPNPNTTSGTAQDFNTPYNIGIPKNIIIRHPNNLGHQFLTANDSNIFYAKKTPPPSCKEIGDGVKQPQEKEMQQMLQSTQPHPDATANDRPNFARPVYSQPSVNKPIFLNGSPARPQPNIHPHYGNPIPTVVNHNLYLPRLPAVRPVRFVSPWPPPNTNVAHVRPPFNMDYNNPHCRMPFVNTTFPRHPMYTEHWRPPMNGNYSNHFTCLPPQPPPPPPAVPVERTVTHSLPVEPPAPTGTVIGSNAEGQLIKKITITALPLPESSVVHEKEKMLAELNSAVDKLEATSEKPVEKVNKDLKSDKMHEVPNVKQPVSSKPCPLSKKKNANSLQNKVNNEVAEKAKAVQEKEAKGYSPPILPIPSYQQAFEILAKNEQKKIDTLKKMETINAQAFEIFTKNQQKRTDVLKKMETINANEEVIIRPMKKTTNKESKNKQINSKLAKNQDDKGPKSKPPDSKPTEKKLPGPAKRKYEKTKKISLEEYKQKLANNNVTFRESSNNKCKKRKKQKGLPVDQDLGYDSDATLVL